MLLTERVEEICDSLDAGRNDFDVLSIGPVLVDLFLNCFAMGVHCECCAFGDDSETGKMGTETM